MFKTNNYNYQISSSCNHAGMHVIYKLVNCHDYYKIQSFLLAVLAYFVYFYFSLFLRTLRINSIPFPPVLKLPRASNELLFVPSVSYSVS